MSNKIRVNSSYIWLASISIIMVLVGCARKVGDGPASISAASGPSMASIYFKSGLPLPNKGLDGAMSNDFTDANRVLVGNLRTILALKEASFEIYGYTDDGECSGESCLALSQRRADLVSAWLIKNGAPASRITVIRGYGSERPLYPNTDEAGRSNNRRVEVHIIWGP